VNEIILFLISAAPVFFLGMYIYKKDKNKEPSKLLAKLFFGGIISCFLVFIFSFILWLIFPFFSADVETLNLIELIIYVFVGIALVEECCKWFMSYKIAYNCSDFEEIFDMIVYCCFVALGFAFFENILYVFQNGIATGILRAVLPVPGHACFGIFMGYYLGMAKQSCFNNRNDLKRKYILLSILVPTIIHGIYDYCLYTESVVFLIIFLVFVILVYIFSIKKVKRMSSVNIKIKYKDNYCSNCGRVVNSNFCPICGKKHN